MWTFFSLLFACCDLAFGSLAEWDAIFGVWTKAGGATDEGVGANE